MAERVQESWSELEAEFNKVKAEGLDEKPLFDRIPEAKYDVTITEAEYSKDERKITFKIFFPNLGKEGLTRTKTSFLSAKSLQYVLAELKRVGQPVESLNNLGEAVSNLRGAIVRCQVKNRKDSDQYQNFYFEEFVGRDRNITEFHQVFNNTSGKVTDDIPF